MRRFFAAAALASTLALTGCNLFSPNPPDGSPTATPTVTQTPSEEPTSAPPTESPGDGATAQVPPGEADSSGSPDEGGGDSAPQARAPQSSDTSASRGSSTEPKQSRSAHPRSQQDTSAGKSGTNSPKKDKKKPKYPKDSATPKPAPKPSPKDPGPSPKPEIGSTTGPIVKQVSFGTVTQDGHTVPVRGTLVVPRAKAGKAPLVVFSHLRAPNCSDSTYAYPCPKGTKEVRYDQGMTYLGKNLAQAGYAILIPDLAPVWVEDSLDKPYDQQKLWSKVMGRLTDRLKSDNAGKSENYGIDLRGRVDFSRVGLMTHSRSATIVAEARDVFGAENLRAVMGYGPWYRADAPGDLVPPEIDVPMLLVNGDEDGDVKNSANKWLTEHIQVKRSTPLLSVQVPGYGHMFVNRKLQKPEADDRKICDIADCPSAADHEKLLTKAATDWFGNQLLGESTKLPVAVDAPLPSTFEGAPARWLAATPGENVERVSVRAFKALPGETAFLCTHTDPMIPSDRKDLCPDPELGVVTSVSQHLHFTGAQATVSVAGAKELAVHALPFGSTEDKRGATLKVTLELAGGGTWETTVDGSNRALADLSNDFSNGEYLTSTIRIPLQPGPSPGSSWKHPICQSKSAG